LGNWLYRLTILGLWLALQAQSVCAASDGLSLIHVTFLNCGGPNAVETVKLHVADVQAHRDVTNEIEYSLQKTPLGVSLDVRLAPAMATLVLSVPIKPRFMNTASELAC